MSDTYKLVFWLLLILSVGPLLGLKAYIFLTGDLDARWLFVRFLPVQILVWGLFLLVILLGIYHKFKSSG